MNFSAAAALAAALLIAGAAECAAPLSLSAPTVVEFENPLASPQPLQGYLRQPDGAGRLARRGAAARLQRQLAAPRRTLGQADRVLGLCDAHRRQLRSARHPGHLQQRRAGRSRLRCLPRPELPGTPALRRSGADRGTGIFARRLAHAVIGRARHHRTDGRQQVSRRGCVLSALPRVHRRRDRTDADPGRRARRLDAGPGVPQDGGGPGRLGNIATAGPGRSDPAHRLSRGLSRLRCPQPQDTEAISGASSRIQPGGNGSVDRRAAPIPQRNDRRERAGR